MSPIYENENPVPATGALTVKLTTPFAAETCPISDIPVLKP